MTPLNPLTVNNSFNNLIVLSKLLNLFFKTFLLLFYGLGFIGVILDIIPVVPEEIKGDVINVLTIITLIFFTVDKYKEWKKNLNYVNDKIN